MATQAAGKLACYDEWVQGRREWTTFGAVLLTGALAACSFDTSVLVDNQEPGATDGGAPAGDGGITPTPDASTSAADAAPSVVDLSPSGDLEESDEIGGSGGGEFGPVSCPVGYVLIGVDADFYLGSDGGAGFCNVRARCSQLRHDNGTLERFGNVEVAPTGMQIGFCGGGETPLPALECASHQFVTGLSMRTSGLYSAPTEMQLQCATATAAGGVIPENVTTSWGQIIGMVDSDVSTACPEQTAATGFGGRVGAVIDAIGLGCQRLAP